MKKINICFMGSPEFSLETLDLLNKDEDIDIRLVVSAKDKKRNRNKFTPTVVKKYAIDNNLEYITPDTVNSEEFLDDLEKYDLDYIVVVAFGQLIGSKLLERYKDRILNLHPSKLPDYRGPSPIQYTLLNGKKETAATTMLIEKGMDSGDILLQKDIQIKQDDDFISLSEKLSYYGARAMLETIKNYDSLYKSRIKQDDSLATFSKKITKEDGLITFNEKGENIINKWRAFRSYPQVFFKLKDENYKIDCLEFIKEEVSNIGNLEVCKDHLEIACKNGIIKIGKIQKPGKKMMDVNSFLRGNDFNVNNINYEK